MANDKPKKPKKPKKPGKKMAVPSYTEDLTDIDLAEAASTGWTAFNISGGGGGAPAFGADLSMQGAGCWDKPCSAAERGLAVNKTPGTGTVAAGIHIFVWGFNATPGITDVLATRGAYVLIGTSTTNYVQFHVEGSDTYGAGGRVGKCYVVDYVTTANTGSIPYRTLGGTPGATPTYFGFGLKTIATAKGSNIGCDAIRYGTGAYITAGAVATPATFDGFATQNDLLANRWGIFTKIGTAYELQGAFAIGQDNAGTGTLAYFEDSDVSVSLIDTVHSATDFTRFLIDHASTEVYWTNILITATGTNNPGYLEVVTDPTAFDMVGCVFTDFGTTLLTASCTATGNTWRACDTVTQGGASLDACKFDKTISTTAAVVTTGATFNSLGSTLANTFVGDGTTTPGHAVDAGSITGGTVGSPTVLTWYNELDNGVTNQSTWEGSTQAATAGTQGTANDAITMNVAAGTYVKVSVAAGANIPTIQNTGTGFLEITANEVTLTITVKDIDTGNVIEGAMVYVTNVAVSATYIDKVETNASGQVTHTTSLGSAQTLAGKVRAATPADKAYTKYYKSSPVAGTFSNVQDTSITIQLITDE
jgi:hypothetical protein